MKLSEDLTAEDKDTFVELLYQGDDKDVAARKIGSTATQFGHCYSVRSQYYDEEFAERVEAALSSPERAQGRIDKIDGYVHSAAERGEWRAIEKLAMIYHPDWEPLRHHNLRVSGGINVDHAHRVLVPHMEKERIIELLKQSGMTMEEISQRVETFKREKEPLALLPPPAA